MKRTALLLVCLLLAAPAWATEYIVNTSATGCSGAPCSDSNNCTALATACLTINGAKIKATSPGDIVTIKAGTYFEDIDPIASGASSGGGTYITFQAALGEAVTVLGSQSISGWAQDGTRTSLYKKTFASKPVGLIEEYATPRFNQIGNGGSWYQSRVGYVDVADNPICGGSSSSGGTCDLDQLNTTCGSKVVNGTWCWIGATGTAYIRPGAYGVNPGNQGNTLPAESVVEDPTANTWREVVHALTISQDWIKYKGITFKDMPLNFCGADHVRFEDCTFLNFFLTQSGACANSTFLEVVGVTAPSVAQDTWKGNSYIENNWSEGDGMSLTGGGRCASNGAACTCNQSNGECAADSQCGGGICIPRIGVPNLLLDNVVLKNTRNAGQLGASPDAIIRNSVIGPGANHGIMTDNEGNGLGPFTVQNTTFFHMQDSMWITEECATGLCTDRRRLNLDHVTVMGPELTRPKSSNSGGIATPNNGAAKWDIVINNSLFWRTGGVGGCQATPTQVTVDGDYNVFFGTGSGSSTSTGTGLAGLTCKLDANTGLHDTVTGFASDLNAAFSTVFEDTTEADGDPRSPHLVSGSPVLNLGGACKGTSCATLTTDYEGTTRPQGPAKDPGADEFGVPLGEVCGNGARILPEVCDCGVDGCSSGDLNSQTCLTVAGGFTGGTLTCCDNVSDGAGCGSTHNCSTFDTTSCTSSSTQCNDGLDNDSDGFTDLVDIGCTDPSDNTETVPGGSSFAIPCTSAGIVQGLAWMNASPGKTVTFACSNTTITFDTATYAASTREITSDGNTWDGGGAGVVVEPSQSWIQSTNCNASATQACDADSNGIPDHCPDANDQTPRFLMIRGDNNTVRGFKIAKWGDGIRFNTGTNVSPSTGRADGNLVENFHCDYPGDNCASGDPPSGGETYADVGRGNIVRNSVCRYACDKCHQIYGRDSGWSDATDFDIKLENITCTDSFGCLRANGNGYFIGDTITVNESGAAPDPQYASASYGIRSDGASTGALLDLTGLTFTGVDTGIIAEGDTQFRLVDSTFPLTGIAAIRLGGTAKGIVQASIFPAGIGINLLSGSTATVDAGAGAVTLSSPLVSTGSTGCNNFTGAGIGIQNGISGYTVKAEGNTWTDSDPSNEVSGTVDFSPVGNCLTIPDPVPSALIKCTACVPTP